LFWGLVPDVSNAITSPGWGCPIAIYKKSAAAGAALTTWNKFTFYFSVPAFPTTSSNAVYKLLMKIGGATNAPIVAWPSLASNLPTYPLGGRLTCV